MALERPSTLTRSRGPVSIAKKWKNLRGRQWPKLPRAHLPTEAKSLANIQAKQPLDRRRQGSRGKLIHVLARPSITAHIHARRPARQSEEHCIAASSERKQVRWPKMGQSLRILDASVRFLVRPTKDEVGGASRLLCANPNWARRSSSIRGT